MSTHVSEHRLTTPEINYRFDQPPVYSSVFELSSLTSCDFLNISKLAMISVVFQIDEYELSIGLIHLIHYELSSRCCMLVEQIEFLS
jgi:hypothetical protein